MRALLLLSAVALLTGCAQRGPQEVGAMPPSVSYSYAPGEEDEVEFRADEYCADYGGQAVEVDQERTGRNGRTVTFECR